MYPPQRLKITKKNSQHISKLRSNTFSTHPKYISNIFVRKVLSLHVAYTCWCICVSSRNWHTCNQGLVTLHAYFFWLTTVCSKIVHQLIELCTLQVFAHFDIMDFHGNRIAEGHKASFCLEDNDCTGPYEAKYDCENYGDQGITPGCKDIYHANIDCQWLDVSELDTGTYIFQMAINPEFKVAEKTFENNMAVCTLIYTQQYASVSNCSYARP